MLSQRVLRPIALFAAIELFIVGGIGAWLAVRLQFPYAYLTPLSLLVYGAAGFYGCRAGAAGWMGGGLVAVLDGVCWVALGGVGPQPTEPLASVAAEGVTAEF